MDEVVGIVFTWQFILAAIVVALLMRGGEVIGLRLWQTGNRRVRRLVVFAESLKVFFPPLFGFALGWVPWFPPMEALADVHRFVFALTLMVAGSCWQYVFMGVRQQLKTRGIDLDMAIPPKEQKRLK